MMENFVLILAFLIVFGGIGYAVFYTLRHFSDKPVVKG
jgi:hypothetical protein